MKYGSQTNNPLMLKWKPPGGITIKAYKVAENKRQVTRDKMHVYRNKKNLLHTCDVIFLVMICVFSPIRLARYQKVDFLAYGIESKN